MGEGILARGVTRAVGGGVLDTATFRALDFVDPLVQAAAKSLGAPIPGVELHNATKTGVLDNFTGMTVETAASIVPLAIATAFRGFGADNRSRIFATASDLQMRALGYPEAEVAAIRAAQIKGTSALSSAIDAAAPQVNGATLEAAAARRELAAQVEQAKQVAKSGILPKFVTTREGTTVIDPDTGKALGPPGTFEEARRLAAAHSSALDGMKGDEVRRLATVLEGPQRPQEIVDSPGEGETRQASAPDEKSPVGQRQPEPFADSQRVQARLAGEEIAAGGRGEVTRSVTGDSKAEFDQDVRRTVTEHLGGTPVQAIVQKVTQEKLADLWDSGAMTREQTVQALRAFDRGAARIEASKNQADETRRLLPEIPDSELTGSQIQEAASRFMAGEILSPRQDPDAPGKLASRPVVTDKLRAAATALAPEATRKWTAFSKALRDHFGVAFTRALKIHETLKSGERDPQAHADFVASESEPSILSDSASRKSRGKTALDRIGEVREEGVSLVDNTLKALGIDPLEFAKKAAGSPEAASLSSDPAAFETRIVSLAKQLGDPSRDPAEILAKHNQDVVNFLHHAAGIPLHTMEGWIRSTEEKTSKSFLPPDYQAMSAEERLQALGKAWQDITARRLLLGGKGAIAPGDMPRDLRSLIQQNALVTELAEKTDPQGLETLTRERHADTQALQDSWRDQAKRLQEKFERLLPGTGKSQYSQGSTRFFDLTREERQIGGLKAELLLIHGRGDGSYFSSVAGELGEVRIPSPEALPSEGAVITHNHPSGAGPSNSDIVNVLRYANSIFRIIARQPDGSFDVYQIRATPEKVFPDWQGSQKEAWTELRGELELIHKVAARLKTKEGSLKALRELKKVAGDAMEIEFKNVR